MNPVTESAILSARSSRAHHVESLSADLGAPVVLVKANMPGREKNTPYARATVNVAARLLFDLFEVSMDARTPSADGAYHVMVIEEDARRIKRVAVHLEDTHRLGRLFDIDVYRAGSKISRQALGHPARRCMICGGDVSRCRREGRHSLKTLHASIRGKVHGFLLDALSEEAAHALRKELYMHPCLALVGPKGSGRHTDMNFSHFLASIEALRPFFRLYLSYGILLQRNLPALRAAGRKGEAAMMKATGGVNTHKGAHFIFGIVLPVFMHSVEDGDTFDDFKNNLAWAADYLLKDDFKHLEENQPSTRGATLYRKKGITGVRGEALSGFNSVFSWYPEQDGSDETAFMRIMARLEDTTLHKGDVDVETMKKAFKACEKSGFEGMDDLLDNYRHLSPGGAADMMALVYFLRASDHLLKWTP